MHASTPVRSGSILAVLAYTGIVASLMQTLVVPLLGQLPTILHSNASTTAWVVTITLLVGAVATPVAGRLGDMLGKRRMLIASTVPLAVGSVIAALAVNAPMMIVGRGLQGLGFGTIPLAVALLRDVLPPEKLGSAIALISSSLGIGGALGLPIAAAITQYSNWRVLFWAAAALVLVSTVLITVVVPEGTSEGSKGRFDGAGAVLLGGGLVAMLLGVSKGSSWGWTSGSILGLFAGALVLLLIWGWWELRAGEPLVDLRITARPQVLVTNIATVAIGVGMYALQLSVPQLLQLPKTLGYGLGQSMLATGLWMAPAGIMMMLISPIGAKLSALRGPKVTLATGAAVMAVGYAAGLPLMHHAWGLLIVNIICSTGVGFAYGAMPALIMGAVPQSETAAANGFNTLMRSVGTSISSAVIGAVLATMSVTLAGHVFPTEHGFRVVFLIGAAVCLVATVICLLIPVRRTVVDQPAEAAAAELAEIDAEAAEVAHA
ncbi:MFS transporter [Nocardia aurantia]|uniref:Multidrug resistance protein 3 n=1 Tax=Nocardia aurantia TaxID=2585199 RepID=A0A7K0DHQ1_9NOCA|nr:MFS transporter [Nocardia aurantia]MQY25177.1 Multidrug resistance protein 3 [Nocardia aurantia]